MSDVFISYKAEEFEEAIWVKNILENNGVSCWMAPMSIKGGSSYAVEIPRAIKACKVFVLILSEKSQNSTWVPKEVDQAVNAGKIILPFMLEDCSLKDDFDFYLTNIQRYRAYESKSAAMEKMLREIKALLGVKEKEEKNSEDEEPAIEERKDEGESNVKAGFVRAEGTRKKTASRQNEKTNKTRDAKSKKPVIIAVLAVIVAIVAAFTGYKLVSTVEVAGEKYNVNKDSYVTIRKHEFTNKDISSLMKLKSLKRFSATECSFPENADLSSLFEGVEYEVELNDCNITDKMLDTFDFIRWRANKLIFSNNPGITSLDRFAPLSDHLLSLQLDNCSISDISILAEFTKLQSFHAMGNKIYDVSFLANCKNLLSVQLNDNQIKSFFKVPGESLLEHVKLDNNELVNLNGFENALKLTTLNVSGNKIVNIDGIKNSTLLKDVDISDNLITDISLLAKSAQTLKTLDINSNSIDNIDAVSDCKELKELYIDDNKITSVYALKGHTALEVLSASNNEISDISSLEKCNKLRYIDVSDNKIISMKALENMTKSETVEIDVSNNMITELALPYAKNFKRLAFYGNSIRSISKESSYAGSEIVFDYSDGIDFEKFAKKLNFYTYVIFDCPLDKQESVKKALGYKTIEFVTQETYSEIEAQ